MNKTAIRQLQNRFLTSAIFEWYDTLLSNPDIPAELLALHISRLSASGDITATQIENALIEARKEKPVIVVTREEISIEL